MVTRVSALILGVLFSFAAPCFSQGEDAKAASHAVFQLENDLFTGSDMDYTNGARLAILRPIKASSLNDLQEWLRGLTAAGNRPLLGRMSEFVDNESIRYEWGYGITQLMFTPDNAEDLVAPVGQRPYAGWLGAEVSLHAKVGNALSSVVLSIGVTGKYSLAQETQDWVHRNISNSPIFQGWDSQMPAEVTINLMLHQKRRFEKLSDWSKTSAIQMDGYFEYGAALGNGLTDAFVGTLLRAGHNLPEQYLSSRIQLGNYSHENFVSDGPASSKFSIYLFGGFRAIAVAHNITLDGPVFKSYDSPVSSEPLFVEGLIGAGIRYDKLTFSFSRTFRTEEFNTQEQDHQFGSFLVSMGY